MHIILTYNWHAMKKITFIFLVAVNFGGAAAIAAPGPLTDDDQFSLSAGFDYSSGKYFLASSTDRRSNPMTGEYENGQWMLKVAVPFSMISSTRVATPGIGNIRADGVAKGTQFGLGDTVAAASYNIYSGKASTFGIDLTGKVKLNSAETGIGFGQNDYAAQADAYQSFNNFTALGSLGYKILGSPAGISMNKVIYGSFGGSYQLDDKLNGGVDIKLSQNPYSMGEGHRELSAYVSHKISKNFKAKGYVLKGFSNGSPDSSLGAQVYYGF